MTRWLKFTTWCCTQKIRWWALDLCVNDSHHSHRHLLWSCWLVQVCRPFVWLVQFRLSSNLCEWWLAGCGPRQCIFSFILSTSYSSLHLSSSSSSISLSVRHIIHCTGTVVHRESHAMIWNETYNVNWKRLMQWFQRRKRAEHKLLSSLIESSAYYF